MTNIKQALELLSSHKYAQAINLLEQAIENNEQQAYLPLAGIHRVLGNWEDAKMIYIRLHSQGDPLALYRLAEVWSELGEPDSLLEELEEIMRPKTLEEYLLIADILISQSYYEQAQRVLAGMDNEDSDLIFMQAVTALMLRDYEKAKKLFLSLDTKSIAVRQKLFLLYVSEGIYSLANELVDYLYQEAVLAILLKKQAKVLSSLDQLQILTILHRLLELRELDKAKLLAEYLGKTYPHHIPQILGFYDKLNIKKLPRLALNPKTASEYLLLAQLSRKLTDRKHLLKEACLHKPENVQPYLQFARTSLKLAKNIWSKRNERS